MRSGDNWAAWQRGDLGGHDGADQRAAEQGPGQGAAQPDVGRDVQHEFRAHGIARGAGVGQRKGDAAVVVDVVVAADRAAVGDFLAVDLQFQREVRTSVEEVVKLVAQSGRVAIAAVLVDQVADDFDLLLKQGVLAIAQVEVGGVIDRDAHQAQRKESLDGEPARQPAAQRTGAANGGHQSSRTSST
ncbi:hypothetical protein G6F40_014181 [Rhizopus arrhizus]|nr:hypothetical protein G6F40_014181 [Rhizopus arrhizus]